MNKFCLLFLTLKLVAQEMPVSESNYFVYDKYNFGVTPTNVNPSLFQQKNGLLICSEYSGFNYKIGNTTIEKALPNSTTNNPILIGYFKLKNGKEYFCSSNKIVVLQNKKISKIFKINSQNDYSNSFSILGNEIYFSTSYKNQNLIVRKFDGKKIVDLYTFKPDIKRYNLQLFVNNKINIVEYGLASIKISSLENHKLTLLKEYTITCKGEAIKNFIDEKNFSGTDTSTKKFICKNGRITFFESKIDLQQSSVLNNFYFSNINNQSGIYELTTSGLKQRFNTTFVSSKFAISNNQETNSFYVATNTNFLRFFPHIKKYPRVYNKSNSTAIFSLTQTNNGKIWAGSYQGSLTEIDSNKTTQSSIKEFMFMNGGLAYKNKIVLFAESGKGALLFSDINSYKKIEEKNTFFYGYISKNDKIYLGSAAKGLWYTNVTNLDKNKPIKWQIVDDKNGLNLANIIFMNEDKFGNIWMGRSSQGIAVYNPETKACKTWQIEKNEISFGSMCSVLDNQNTIWFGKSDGGLCFYDGKIKTDYNVNNFKSIDHPLLKNELGISFLQQWNNFLILGAKDKILLFDLKKWRETKEVFIRYLNPQETNFSTHTEQNACLVDKRDQSVWFSTSDNLYQWDIKKWLTLPTFTVTPTIIIKKETLETEYKINNQISFEPTQNSFDIQIQYQTPDNLPRYLNATLVKKGEKPNFELPNLETKFHFANLNAGNYIFYVRVCQQDGSFDVFEYPVFINNFLWQKWWFWLLMSFFPIGFIVYYFKKKNEIEITKKKLSQLNLASLSNQFRPHFMLNALNSIGSQMEQMPHAEKVISRLGESINILYGFTQSNDFTHEIKNEWKLVENIIEIQKLLFIPDLEVKISNVEFINIINKVPVGLIQIPIENALLHGLRNKEKGPYCLEINFFENEIYYGIEIIDTGVGRKKASEINNFKNNGNGLKTIFQMIEIINNQDPKAIIFEILDQLIGTKVIIQLKKTIDYDKIKL